MRKSFTSMGTPVETNYDEEKHNHVVTLMDRMEKLALKRTNGKYNLLDFIKDDKLREAFKTGLIKFDQ